MGEGQIAHVILSDDEACAHNQASSRRNLAGRGGDRGRTRPTSRHSERAEGPGGEFVP